MCFTFPTDETHENSSLHRTSTHKKTAMWDVWHANKDQNEVKHFNILYNKLAYSLVLWLILLGSFFTCYNWYHTVNRRQLQITIWDLLCEGRFLLSVMWRRHLKTEELKLRLLSEEWTNHCVGKLTQNLHHLLSLDIQLTEIQNHPTAKCQFHCHLTSSEPTSLSN